MKEKIVIAAFWTAFTLTWLAIPFAIGWALYTLVHPAVGIIVGIVALFPSGWLMNRLLA